MVDNGSNNNTQDVAKDYADKYPQLVGFFIEDKIQSSYAARNKGIEKCRGGIIAFLDSNVRVEKNYLSQINEFFQNNDIDYLGCRVELVVITKTITALYNSINDFNIKRDIYKNHYSPTCSLTIRRKVIDIIGLFDSCLESGGDWDLGQRVFKAGLKQAYADDIVVYHSARWRYSSLVEKSKRIARGIAQMTHYYPLEYAYLYKRYFHFQRYLPSNPQKIYKSYNGKANIEISLIEALILSSFHIPMRLISLITLIAEKRKLKNNNRNKFMDS